MSFSFDEMYEKMTEKRYITKINHKHKIEIFLNHLLSEDLPHPDKIYGDFGGEIFADWNWKKIEVRILFDHRGENIIFGVLGLSNLEKLPNDTMIMLGGPVHHLKYEDVDTVKKIMREVYAHIV